MDKPIPEAVVEASCLCTDGWCEGCRELITAINTLTAAQQQGQAVALDRMAIRLLVAAGFVTEDKANEALRIAHGFDKGPLAPPSAPVGVEEAAEDAAAIDKAWDRFNAALAQQPAAVDEAMVERACTAMGWQPYAVNRDKLRACLTAALATQHQEPTT